MRGKKMNNNTYCDCGDGDRCKDFYDDYDENNDNYVIQRLENIISICEFLIEHEKNKQSRKILDDMLDKAAEKSNDEAARTFTPKKKYRYYPLYIPVKYPNPNRAWWDNVWF